MKKKIVIALLQLAFLGCAVTVLPKQYDRTAKIAESYIGKSLELA